MKPIWFTEYGFPSVDGAANQPNVFYDPSSSESFFPRGSRGRVDFQAQREAVSATLDYLQARNATTGNDGLVPRSFLWTWDARPFSFWPDLEGVWKDSQLWNTGHWVQGKLGNSTLGAVVGDLLQTTGLKPSDYDVTRLTETLEGFIIDRPITARAAIEYLTAAFFFDVVESDGILKCVPRGNASVISIPEADLIATAKDSSQVLLGINYAQELELPQRVNVTYLDRPFNYDPVTQSSQRQVVKSVDQVSMNLPIVMGGTRAKQIADITLYSAWKERVGFSLMLPPKYVRIEPTDIITVTVNGVVHEMRVVKTDMESNGVMKIDAAAEDISSYDFYTPPGETGTTLGPPAVVPGTSVIFVDTPPLPADTVSNQGLLRIGVAPEASNWEGSVIYRSDDGGSQGGNTFGLLAGLDGSATFGVTTEVLGAGPAETWDRVSNIEVVVSAGALASTNELAVLNGANAAMIGDELIQFRSAELVGNKRYRLTQLLRGRQGTEWAIGSHVGGERFVLLSSALYTQSMPSNLIGRELFYKAVSVGNSLGNTDELSHSHTGRNLKPFAPVHIKANRDAGGDVTLSWVRRSRIDAEWRDLVDIPLGEESERYEVDIMDGQTVVRTIASVVPIIHYSVSDQTVDFGSAQSSITANIHQLSALVGRGYVAAITA
jgi:hypothetical protein